MEPSNVFVVATTREKKGKNREESEGEQAIGF